MTGERNGERWGKEERRRGGSGTRAHHACPKVWVEMCVKRVLLHRRKKEEARRRK